MKNKKIWHNDMVDFSNMKDGMVESDFKLFITKLGIYDFWPAGVLTAEMLQKALSTVKNNFGQPNEMLISESLHKTLKNITFDADNLK